MALGSTQPLTEMSTRVFPGGKGGRCVRLTTLPPSRAVVTKSGNLNFLEPSGPLGLLYRYNNLTPTFSKESLFPFLLFGEPVFLPDDG